MIPTRPAIYPIDLLRRVRDMHLVRKAERLVLDALILRADWSDYCASMALPQLMLDTLLDENEVLTALEHLQRMGLIEIEHRQYSRSIYRINVERIRERASDTRIAQQLIEAVR